MFDTNLYISKGIFSKSVALKSARDGFGDALFELGETSKDVVALCADLVESTKVIKFAQKYPDRFFEVGIAEQNMAGISAGLALSGKIPFMASYAIFSPGRNWEQIRLAICLTNANVKIVATHAGLSVGPDGGMAQCLEDIALTRVLPNLTVLSPLDYVETKKAVFAAAKHVGPVYIRLPRADTPVISTINTPFEIGKALLLKEGKNVSIMATGPMVYEALLAIKELKGRYKIEAEVINISTIKPLDEQTILNSAKKTGTVVTVEDHQKTGGMGSAVAELLSEKYPVKVLSIGVNDTFGESGNYQELKDKYGLSAHHIVNKVVQFLAK